MKKSLLFMCVLAVALASCSRGELPDEPVTPTPPDPGKEDLVEIRLQSAVNPLEANTKTPFIGDITTSTNELTANVLMTKTAGGFAAGSTIEQSSMTFKANETSTPLWGGKQYYPVDNSSVFLCGLHPDGAGWTQGTDESTMTYTFNGKTDVMAAREVETKKTQAQQETPTYPVLAFKHLLTNLIVKAEVVTEADVTAADVQKTWGAITSIELAKVQGDPLKRMNKVTVTLKDATAATATAFSLDATYAVGFYKMSGKNFPGAGVSEPFVFTDDAFASTPIPDPAAAVAYSIIAPVVTVGVDKADFTLLVKTENTTSAGGVEVPVKLSATGDTQGKYCIVTLKFKNTTISATASVAAWTQGSTADTTIQ
ncbi:MAG: hypothetical protein PARBA_03299 [Parabacteroides sp.]